MRLWHQCWCWGWDSRKGEKCTCASQGGITGGVWWIWLATGTHFAALGNTEITVGSVLFFPSSAWREVTGHSCLHMNLESWELLPGLGWSKLLSWGYLLTPKRGICREKRSWLVLGAWQAAGMVQSGGDGVARSLPDPTCSAHAGLLLAVESITERRRMEFQVPVLAPTDKAGNERSSSHEALNCEFLQANGCWASCKGIKS